MTLKSKSLPIHSTLAPLVAALLSACGAQVDIPTSGGSTCQSQPPTVTWPVGPVPSGVGLGGQCLDKEPWIDASGNAACFVLDLRATGGACGCDAEQGLSPVAPAHKSAAADVGPMAGCACEIQAIAGDPAEVAACENQVGDVVTGAQGQPLNGWCFIDPGLSPPRGSEALTASCPSEAPRLIRLVGAPAGALAGERTVVFVCQMGAADGCSD